MSIFKRIVAKLTGMEGWPKPKAETGEEKFKRTEQDASRMAEANRQANLRRMQERAQRQANKTAEETDPTKELEQHGQPPSN